MYQDGITELSLKKQSVFELFDHTTTDKTIVLDTAEPRKYAALVLGSNTRFTLLTGQDQGNLEMIIVCRVRDMTATHITITLNLQHNNCKVQLTMIALVESNAATKLDATIIMQPHLQHTNGHLLEETIILSPEVKITNLPILDIHAKHIQASHGAKIYHLDQDKLFYLQAKGLSFLEAQNLLLASYGERLFKEIPISQQEKDQYISRFLTFTGQ